MSAIGIMSMVVTIILAIVVGIYVGDIIRNRNRGKSSKGKNQ
jgi:hypothetical protein